jgi:hypothetical protein
MKTIEVDQTTKLCPECEWTPGCTEARFSDLTDHITSVHHMGEPFLGVKHIFVTGFAFKECKIANFIQ